MCSYWPKEWDNIMDSDLKDYFIEEEIEDDVPEDFFTYCYEMFFEKYINYKPFFTCFEKGEEVFENFYKIYGESWDLEEGEELEDLEDLTDEQLLIQYIDGINYLQSLVEKEGYREAAKHNMELLQSLGAGEFYDIGQMEIKRVTYKEFKEQYDEDDLEYNSVIWEYIEEILDEIVWPKFEENFIMNFIEPFYQLFGDYKVIDYILWPIAKREDIENPFKPYVELREREMEVYIIDKNTLVIVE